ncbi:LOW QUALITY PROTEIN: gibberellin 2-beta-dioxygenase 2-like [Salvia miltiorrhiza]|uniref:LOW QUALITY PROTEIN: gibberellin 2-beta-dioxygenase 2-like n=1 Tax=Salvia miltiorrhiza TaxID=226208 RepID=UPI0025AD430B|nr:LOW QUALITY PROTEIN: gibberellin 2-beta-dioxygenase 2-like [Salvia miltiorrhiza]
MENITVGDDHIELPIVDLRRERSEASRMIVKACEEFGFFKVINHGVKQEIISLMEEEASMFFSKPVSEKNRAGPPDPYGYGSHNIGLNGDVGEVEYLLLQANPLFISHKSKYISSHPQQFSYVVSRYVEAVRELACEILDLIVEGLWAEAQPVSTLSGLVRDLDSDSLIRLNHYPPTDVSQPSAHKIGFGAHTDPQILTILRSNGSSGLQLSLQGGVWVPVDPHPPSAFCVNVGDVLQAMTNGRFVSVKHRAVVNSIKSRMSIVYFAAPPLHATITCIASNPTYRSFSWGEYKKVVYTGRLNDCRLNLFKLH